MIVFFQKLNFLVLIFVWRYFLLSKAYLGLASFNIILCIRVNLNFSYSVVDARGARHT